MDIEQFVDILLALPKPTLMPIVEQAHELCRLLGWRLISPNVFIERCASLILGAIDCSRVGIWLFAKSDAGQHLRCLGMYDGERGRMTLAPDELVGVEGYFDALQSTGYVMAHDVMTCESTKGSFGRSLHERGVLSLMATSFSVNGRLYGVFSCTSVGKQILWDTKQLVLLKRIGSRVSIALASSSLSKELGDVFSFATEPSSTDDDDANKSKQVDATTLGTL